MFGPSGAMDWSSTPRLNIMLLTVFLLVSTNIICLHGNPITGVDHNLKCVNNYLFTINCSLSIPPSENPSDSNTSYWLTIKENGQIVKFVCMLTNVNGDYFCSVKIANPEYYDDNHLDDMDEFEIKLCHNKSDGFKNCELLNDAYTPQNNIKPNTPCCLTVSHNSSQRRFAWKSTYEQYSSFSTLGNSLKYQLQFFKRGDKHQVTLSTTDRHFSVDDENFAPGTEYAARVRSSPDLSFFKGVWSDWSSEVYWETLEESAVDGVDHNLKCVNDYLFTINCSLSIPPSENPSDSNTSYKLTIMENGRIGVESVCMLTNVNGDYFCSVKIANNVGDHLDDMDEFEIKLCHNKSDGSENCELLNDAYTPQNNIKPNTPCCLTVSHNSSQRRFAWKSTYEQYSSFTTLGNSLKYQLQFFKRGDKHQVTLSTTDRHFSVDDENFAPGTEYAARVRSSPDLSFFKGVWSDWSSEVYWETLEESAVDDKIGLGKVLILVCVAVPLLLLLCCAPVKKWKQRAFIPTPAPYFQTLYSDCQGDFKSWVITQENTADMLKAEQTLQIDVLTKFQDIHEEVEEECQPEFHHQLMEGSTYSNIIDPGCSTSLLGIPYAVSTMSPLSAQRNSLKSLTLSSLLGSPAEGDSGCWLCSHTSLERDPPFYCNEYCTLSAFQQISPIPAALQGSPSTKPCPTEIVGVEEAFAEA